MMRFSVWFTVSCVLCLAGCAGPQSIGISQQKWSQLSDKDKQAMKSQYSKVRSWQRGQGADSVGNKAIAVTIVGGTAKMPPDFKSYHFKKVSVNLADGKCTTARIMQLSSEHSTNLRLCYIDSLLSIDPSHYEWQKRAGTLLLTKNPMWRQGLVYHGKHIDSEGYVSLHDVAIHVKEIQGQ